MNVAQADIVEGLKFRPHRRHRREELERLRDGHLQHVRDRTTLVVDLERFPVIALALADLARDIDVGQELHLDLEDTVALAVLAAATFDVEAEAARLVSPNPGLLRAGEEIADRGEEAGVSSRVRSRRSADRALVDVDDLVDRLDALEPIVLAGLVAGAIQLAGQGPVQDVGDERALARSRDARHGHETGQRKRHDGVLEVVLAGAPNDDRKAAPLAPGLRNRHFQLAAKVGARYGSRLGEDGLERP